MEYTAISPNKVRAAEKIRQWRYNPIQFVEENFHVEPDPMQKEVLMAFGDCHFTDPRNQRIAMKASKGPGKTAVESWCAWNFLATRLHPKIAATSITGDNLQDNLWSEMSKWQQRSDFLRRSFEWGKTRIVSKTHPETWFMSARLWPRNADATKQADTLAGFRAEYVLFILDESGGIPDAVMATAEGGLSTGVESRIIQGGNPTHLEGPLYRACTSEAHLWRVFTANGDPDAADRSPRVSIKWAREQIEKYGRMNPWVLVNVFGEFPPSSINALLGPDDMARGINRKIEPHMYSFAAKILGVDVARFGDSRSVIFPRQGLYARRDPIILREQNTTQVAGHTAREFDDWQADQIFVDDTGGWGSGVIDALNALGYPVIGVNSSSKALNPRYMNKRAENYFEAAEWVKRGGALPDEVKAPGMTKEATAATYFFNAGRLQIIDKDQMIELLGVSPDIWDAFTLTFSLPVAPKPGRDRIMDALGINRPNIQSDYDPYSEENIKKEFGE